MIKGGRVYSVPEFRAVDFSRKRYPVFFRSAEKLRYRLSLRIKYHSLSLCGFGFIQLDKYAYIRRCF